MKANELRKGNFIIYSPEPNLIKMVSGIKTERDINKKEYERVYFIDINMNDCRGKTINWIKPIPLTEEWLLKFGFGKYNDCFDYAIYINGDICTFRIMICDNGWWFIIDKPVGDGMRIGINLGTYKYIHQLQNLYFVLTGKELEIKDNGTDKT